MNYSKEEITKLNNLQNVYEKQKKLYARKYSDVLFSATNCIMKGVIVYDQKKFESDKSKGNIYVAMLQISNRDRKLTRLWTKTKFDSVSNIVSVKDMAQSDSLWMLKKIMNENYEYLN